MLLNIFIGLSLLSGNDTTPTYTQLIKQYRGLESQHPKESKLNFIGQSDSGDSLFVFRIFSKSTPEKSLKVLVNNGIHPGEPDGINASLELVENILKHKYSWTNNLDIAVIPCYNVDGAKQRGTSSRANQAGPKEYGFRANARNLDLNRDFIKLDSRNARTWVTYFNTFSPNWLIDTHVSNGSDYQYTLTFIPTQKDKAGPVWGPFLAKSHNPKLMKSLASKGQKAQYYVNTLKETPDSGLVGFLESPRFATGYSILKNCPGYTIETHMLKPFENRVKASLVYLEAQMELLSKQVDSIKTIANIEYKRVVGLDSIGINYELQQHLAEEVEFMGYQAGYKPSVISNLMRLYYDRQKPYTKKVKYYDSYVPAAKIKVPEYYIVSAAYPEVIERLKMNGIPLKKIKKDTLIDVNSFKIKDFQTVKKPYEGHYLHYGTSVEEMPNKRLIPAGFYIVNTRGAWLRYLVEVLDPRAQDSFFAWNFFDSCLQQKEGYSDYVFEDLAVDLLKENSRLASDFEEYKKSGAKPETWLSFIYQHSKYYEPHAFELPVYSIYK